MPPSSCPFILETLPAKGSQLRKQRFDPDSKMEVLPELAPAACGLMVGLVRDGPVAQVVRAHA